MAESNTAVKGPRIPTLLVTGAGGAVGKSLLSTLPKGQFHVIAGVSPSDPPLNLLKSLFDQKIELDFDVSETVNMAFEKNTIDYLFLIPSKSEERALEAKRLIAVGIENNVKFIVLISMLDCHARTGILAAQFRYIEQYIEATGVPYTILRAAPLQQNFLDFKTGFDARLATISLPIGMGSYAPIHSDDIAAVAKRVLEEPKEHAGKTYRLTGPELLTGVQISGKAAMGLDRPVRFINRNPPSDAYKTTWAKILDMELYGLISRGFFTSVSSDVFNLTGVKGISLTCFFKENEAFFNGDRISSIPRANL